jgi:DNA-binding PadR family transcriptional regulator
MPENHSVTLPLNPRVLMILLSFAEGPAHGYEIKKRAEHRSAGSVRLDAGSLYRSIAQLLDQHLIEEVAGPAERESQDTRRKYYGLTVRGRELVVAEAQRLAGLVEYAVLSRLIEAPWTAR